MRTPHRALWRPFALVVALAALPTPAHAASVLANGSFETGPDPGAVMSIPAGSLAIGNWTVTRGGIRYAGTSWSAAQGARSVALNGTDAGGIRQTFATVPGAQYTLRLYMAGDPGTTPAVKTMAVSANGQSANFSKDITGMWAWDPGWDLETFTFFASDDSTTLELYSTISGTTGPFVDSVSVQRTFIAGVGDGARRLALEAPAPNPAPGACRFAFTLPAAMPARLAILDVGGREIASMGGGTMSAGRHELSWDGRAGNKVAPPGVYLVVLHTPDARLARRLLLVD
jgi:choice-of-anchor C domain-containing protein